MQKERQKVVTWEAPQSCSIHLDSIAGTSSFLISIMHHFVQLRTVLLPGWRHSGPYIDFQQKTLRFPPLIRILKPGKILKAGASVCFFAFPGVSTASNSDVQCIAFEKSEEPLISEPQ